MIRLTILVLSAGLLTCSQKPEVFRLPIDMSGFIARQEAAGKKNYRFENFIINHPPAELNALRALVDSFNIKTLCLPNSENEFEVVRRFYKETAFTPRTYREFVRDRGFLEHGKDDILDHSKDLILEYTIIKGIVSPGPVYPAREFGKIFQDVFYTFYNNDKILDKYSIHIHEILGSQAEVPAEDK